VRAGWALSALGVAVIVWAVLGVASAAYGSRPKYHAGERRSYDMVKREVHRTFPLALAKALCGLGLAIAGSYVRGGSTTARKSAPGRWSG